MSLFRIGQVLKGRIGTYTITKEIRGTVWFASNQLHENVVIKSVQDHPRVENERDALYRFQHRTSHLRPVIDVIEMPSKPVTIAMKYLDSDLLAESTRKSLNRNEMKYVCRCILEALSVIHSDGYVHTDVKPDNVFVNLQQGNSNSRFSEVQLGDLGGCYSIDSKWAKSGTFIGAPMWTSPEVILELPWNTASDIWSFGNVLINLIYGGHYNIFPPKIDPDHEEFSLEVIMKQYRFFAPFPPKIQEVLTPESYISVQYLIDQIPSEKWTPFSWITEREIIKKDKDFIGTIMKLDWRDRPTAKQLLADDWFKEDDEETKQAFAALKR